MIRRGPRRLGDDRLSLREIVPGDVDDLFRWRSQPRVQPLFHSTAAVSRQEHGRFVARYFEPDNDDAWFVIEVDREAAGAVALYRTGSAGEWEAGRIVLDARFRGHGGFSRARRAIALLQDFARAAGHVSMRCEVLADNRVMLGIVRSLGFVDQVRDVRNGRPFIELVAPLGEGADASS